MSHTTVAGPPRVPVAPATTPSRAGRFWGDTGLVLVRELRPLVRDPFSMLFGLVQPLFFLALFGPLLVSSLGGTDALGGDVWLWFVPSILVMSTLFGTTGTGSNLQMELVSGSHERLLVTPMSRSAMLVGRALKEVVPVVVQALVVVLVMLPFGLRPDPLGVVLTLGQLAVLGVGIGGFSYALALAVRKQEWMFWVVQQTVIFPLMLLSGMLLPLDGGPAWMRTVSYADPLRYVVDAARELFAGDLASPAVLWGWVAALLTAAAGLAVGVRTMERARA
ncbi:ABC transporter permease [Isoptericola cucumis]|uniref:Transport permease protein n=1 Tax=Isoptericola cucumis TaxID=1776856 RepID=A0ABQ2B3V6_9MICO|nr:ABC transporter permease [Isoptericola cucumis]GGI05447.1 transport permease protein [Isoptericola cucumis]